MNRMPDHHLTALKDLEAYWADRADITEAGGPNEAMEQLAYIRELIAERSR